jgi:hydrophobe/amphiphile efflux-1 (HAE1) family protein
MISFFFLKRPVFAMVSSILIVLLGLVALLNLPIEQYPNIVPPQVQVTVSYPGASAETIADSVAAPLENQINGVENMLYMYSQNSATGNLAMSIYFMIGSDPNTALNNVQDRVDLALAQLPAAVQKQGITVKKETPTILLLVSIESDHRYDEIYTNNYATIHVADDVLRLSGVSDAKVINARDYAMRVWLRPDKMAQLYLGTSDVVNAIQEQNADYPIGQLGQVPTSSPVPLTLPVTGLGRLEAPEEYDSIILRANSDGSTVRIKDVGYTELGAQNYTVNGALNGKTSSLIAIYQEYGANALTVAAEVKKKMERLSQSFPPGITYSIPYDTTKFIKISIEEVEKTLYEAAILVALVIIVFLQSIRASIVPIIAMVVSIIGTFIGMYILGFSLNTLTLFALVLSIGIVVDDAIVVVENVERNLREKDLSPMEAATLAMKEVSSPIIAIVCVLCAVFIPVAFLGGIAGGLYKQFAITISISVVISGFVALTLSPVLSAFLLKKQKKQPKIAQIFNRGLHRCTQVYVKGAGWLLDNVWVAAVLFGLLLISVGCLLKIIPTSLVPQEDQGYVFAFANLPEEASLDRTQKVTDEITKIVLNHPAVESFISMTGFSLLDNLNRTPVGTYFVILKDWRERTSKDLSLRSVMLYLLESFYKIPEGLVMPFNPPAIQGLGTVGGFEFWLLNEGSGSQEMLEDLTNQFITAARKRPELTSLTSSIDTNCLQIFADVDRTQAKALKVSIGDVYQTLQSLLGSVYVNNFNKFGHVFQVVIQADPNFRSSLEDLGNIYLRSANHQMVPLKSLVTFQYVKGPNLVSRFNGFPASKINGAAAPGFSSGDALNAMTEVAKEILPFDVSYSWGGQAYQEVASGGTSYLALIGGLIVVFLILAALYERWSLPLAILLVVPFGTLGALLAVWFARMQNDVYFQIGLVTLIALAAKNAILIVEFAIIRRKEGIGVREAALEAAGQRFRAIMMTSLTFILGVLPLVLSKGAGAASRHSVGVGVMGGMIFATFFGIFFVPVFYKVLERDKGEGP